MAATPAILKLAEAIHRAGIQFPWEQGARIARGYADLGAEEFVIVGPRRIVSLFTGQITEIESGHEKFFFRVPTLDELIEEISRREAVLVNIRFVDARNWRLDVRDRDNQEFSITNASLEEAFLEALGRLVGVSSKDAGAQSRLRVERQ